MARLQRLKSKAVTSFNNENAAGGVFTALDRTMSGIEMQTRVGEVGESIWSTSQDVTSVDPATFDPNKMTLRLSAPEAGITTDEGLIRVTGYNYHELSHLIYGPPTSVTESFINTVANNVKNHFTQINSGDVYSLELVRGLIQVILCMHSEHRMLRQYLGIAPYFIEVLVDRIHQVLEHIKRNLVPADRESEVFTAATYVLFAGRIYFPKSFREHMRNVFVEKRTAIAIEGRYETDSMKAWDDSKMLADGLEKELRRFLALDLFDSSQGGIATHLRDTVIVLCRVLLPFRAYNSTEYLNVFHLAQETSKSQSPQDSSRYGSGVTQVVKQLEAERKKNNQAANNSPEVPENEDSFEGEGGDEDSSDSGSGSGSGDKESDQDEPQDGQGGGETEEQDDSPEEENEAADGDSEDDDEDSEEDPEDDGSDEDSDEDSDDEDDEPEQSIGDGGNQAGTGTGEHPAPQSLTDQLKDKLDSLTDYVKGNSQIQNEVRERRRAVVNPTGKQMLNFADRAKTTEEKVTPEMTLLAKRVEAEFAKLTEDADPGFIRNQSSGRLNIQRAMTGDVELDQLFDRWDEGQTDATEVEAVYLIDVSGSMNSNINQVTRALWVLKRGIEASSNNSGITVLAYDSDFEIMAGAEDKEKIGTYRNLSTNGGTSPHRALQAAQAILTSTRRSNKLLTILTDGTWSDELSAHAVIDEINAAGINTGLMFYPNYGWGGSTQLDPHHCQVSTEVKSLSDVLTFTKTMIRNSMRV